MNPTGGLAANVIIQTPLEITGPRAGWGRGQPRRPRLQCQLPAVRTRNVDRLEVRVAAGCGPGDRAADRLTSDQGQTAQSHRVTREPKQLPLELLLRRAGDGAPAVRAGRLRVGALR